jgi:ubiquinone/menaquinone biosynthesis C-methylase UbiE
MIISPKILGGAELVDADQILKEAGLAEKMQVADFGSGGRAYFALHSAKLVGPNGLIYAIDILKANLQSVEDLARFYNFRNIKTVWADLEVAGATKIPSANIDLVIIANLLFQTRKHKEIFQEAHRILKKDGKVLLVEWKKTASPLGPPVEMRVDIDQVKKTIQENGFKLDKEFEAGPYHHGLIFIKN